MRRLFTAYEKDNCSNDNGYIIHSSAKNSTVFSFANKASKIIINFGFTGPEVVKQYFLYLPDIKAGE